MDTGQNQTDSAAQTPQTAENVRPPELLKFLQNEYITFCAASGMSMTEDGEFVTMTVSEFAQKAGVARSTLYDWQKRIPNFWKLVDDRAREIFNQSTKFAIFKGQKLKAMAGDTKAAEFVLSHYSDYTPPAQKHEVKLTGWADMVREARKSAIKNNRPTETIEAEVIEPNPYAAVPEAATRVDPPIEPPVPAQPDQPAPVPSPQPQPEPNAQISYPQNPQPNPQPQGGIVKTDQPIII